MTQLEKWWQKVINSRMLAGIGVVVLLLAGGFTISSIAQAQSTNYTYMTISIHDWNTIQQQIQALNNRVTALESRVSVLQNTQQTVYVPTPSVPPPVTYTYPTNNYSTTYPAISNPSVNHGPVTIDQNGGTYQANFDIYFTGRGFTPYEQVLISRNGVNVGHTNADAGGNISSSGVFLPLGAQTFTFTGQTSGISVVTGVQGVSNVVSGSI